MLSCRIPKSCYHDKKGRYCAKYVVTLKKCLVQDAGRYFLHSGATANFHFKNSHLVTIATGLE